MFCDVMTGLRRRMQKHGGYTIIEMAIVMTVIGVMMASAAGVYKVYVHTQKQSQTAAAFNNVTDAINGYLTRKGRFPCPARLDAVRGDPDYGRETECDSTKAGYPAALPLGSCANGLCIQASYRADLVPAPKVRRGAVPFRDMNLPEIFAEDGYGLRLAYVVTEKLAVAETFKGTDGGIGIIDAAGNSHVSPADTAPYMLISAGPDKLGSYTRYGVPGMPCPASGMDALNCAASGTNAISRYRYTAAANTADANHFDDIIKFPSPEITPAWRIADAASLDVKDLLDTNGKVGIGVVPDTTVPAALQVSGLVRAGGDAGDVQTGDLCDQDGAGCFPLDLISGDDPRMDCTNPAHPGGGGPGYIAGGVDHNALDCVPPAGGGGGGGVSAPAATCPDGYVMVGIDSAGKLDCLPVTDPCPAVSGKQICTGYSPDISLTFDIPANIMGATFKSPVAGDSYTENYICEDKVWKLNYTNGTCACAASSTPHAKDCNTTSSPQWPPSGAGQGGYSGTYTDIENITCGPQTAAWTYNSPNECVCDPTTPPQTTPQAVPPGCAGTINTVKTWTCTSPGPSPLAYGTWASATVNNATCQLGFTQDYDESCPLPGYAGYVTKTRTVTACTGTSATAPPCDSTSPQWTETGSVDHCACIDGYKLTQIRNDCPAGTTGTTTWRQTLTCPDSWSPWTRTSYDCVSTSYTWAAGTYFADGASPLPNVVGMGCPTQGVKAQCSDSANKYYNDCVCQ